VALPTTKRGWKTDLGPGKISGVRAVGSQGGPFGLTRLLVEVNFQPFWEGRRSGGRRTEGKKNQRGVDIRHYLKRFNALVNRNQKKRSRYGRKVGEGGSKSEHTAVADENNDGTWSGLRNVKMGQF